MTRRPSIIDRNESVQLREMFIPEFGSEDFWDHLLSKYRPDEIIDEPDAESNWPLYSAISKRHNFSKQNTLRSPPFSHKGSLTFASPVSTRDGLIAISEVTS